MSAAGKAHRSALPACALVAVALLGASPAPAAPGASGPTVSVSDAGGGRIAIEAHEASLRQVLDALQVSHLIQFRGLDPVARTVTGTYTGTLPQVLSRILDGFNSFLQVTPSVTRRHIVNLAPGNGVVRSVVAPVAMAAPNPRRPVSSNVDADDERAEEGATRPPATKAPAWVPRSATMPYPVVPTPTAPTPAPP